MLYSDGTYAVQELATELIVAKKLLKEEAKLLCRKLNLGSGFDGRTPQFFMKDFKYVN